MARPLRIAYEGAWYHIMNRGRRLEAVFSNVEDYELFVALLKETSEMWGARISAYCLMPDHYHLLIQTPLGNITRTMRHIDGVYTQRFNRRHGLDGPLFRGRYKSILVAGGSYLLPLVRYIHRVPLKAGLADSLSEYTWSSHKGYLSAAKKWDWLHKHYIYAIFSSDNAKWIKRYRQFVSIEEDDEVARILGARRWPSVWGPKAFVDWVKAKYYETKIHNEIPQPKSLIPSHEDILLAVCDYYDIDEEEIYKVKRGTANEPRNVSILLMRQLRKDRLEDIGRRFRMGKYSSVSSVIERTKKLKKIDPNVSKRIEEVSLKIVKGQRRT